MWGYLKCMHLMFCMHADKNACSRKVPNMMHAVHQNTCSRFAFIAA